ncbi:MAG: hypothetical protein H6899_02975 [Rhodobacter sp.]|nr:hypothetical protein [Paracoccaceae bacterium]MCC0078922.1 hypothetical protein [Rhodobacter sp.]
MTTQLHIPSSMDVFEIERNARAMQARMVADGVRAAWRFVVARFSRAGVAQHA